MKKIILDATAFLEQDTLFPDIRDALLFTVPEVLEEAKSKRELIDIVAALKVVSPDKKFLLEAKAAVDATGDSLSDADEKVVALALQENGAVVASDDYGVQNVCRHLGIEFLTIGRPGIKEEWRYAYRCRGCGRIFGKETKVCPVCGHEVRKVRKRQ